MAELEHKSFQDRLEQKGKTPNFIRKSRARVCGVGRKRENEIQQRENCVWMKHGFSLVGKCSSFSWTVPTLTHVTNGGQFFRRLALFINVDTTNDFPPYLNYLSFHLSNRSSTNERWSFQPSPNFSGLSDASSPPPFVFPDFAKLLMRRPSSFLCAFEHLEHYLSLFKTPSRQVH